MSKTAREVIAGVTISRGIDASEADLFRMESLNAHYVVAALEAAGFVIVPKEPTEERISAVAQAIKDCADKFQNPVNFYVEPESRRRWEEQNPTKDPYAEQPETDWDFESYRIIARAALGVRNPK